MKKLILSLVLCGGILFVSQQVEAGDNICFCHAADSNPHTICTSDDGKQQGHTSHGDIAFGCECGDGVCDTELGEDCGTCPGDCGFCTTCEDGVVDPGEECGEEGLSCFDGETCVGCRCMSTCGNQQIDVGERCDGDDCCDADCMPLEECGGIPVCEQTEEICDGLDNNCNGDIDEGDVCVVEEGVPAGSASLSAGGGLCSLNKAAVINLPISQSLMVLLLMMSPLVLFRCWKGTR